MTGPTRAEVLAVPPRDADTEIRALLQGAEDAESRQQEMQAQQEGSTMSRPEDTANVALPEDETEAARRVIAKVTEAELHNAIRTLARRDPVWWRTELARLARIEGHTDILGGHR